MRKLTQFSFQLQKSFFGGVVTLYLSRKHVEHPGNEHNWLNLKLNWSPRKGQLCYKYSKIPKYGSENLLSKIKPNWCCRFPMEILLCYKMFQQAIEESLKTSLSVISNENPVPTLGEASFKKTVFFRRKSKWARPPRRYLFRCLWVTGCDWCIDAAEALQMLLMMLMHWCCWCTDAAYALILLMRCCYWCADAADMLMLLMMMECHLTSCVIWHFMS